MDTMASWFGLKDGKRDFWIENDTDSRLLFARQTLDENLHQILRKSFRTASPPKFVIYGDWGVGKTHTLHHVKYVIDNTESFSATCVFIELLDITAKSNFQTAHAAVMDAVGLERTKQWMYQFQTKHQSLAKEKLQEETHSEDIARAFMSVSTYGDNARIAWDWLRGLGLSSADARAAGLPPLLEQSSQLVSVLRILGHLSMDVDGKLLIVLLDEGDKLQFVSNADAIGHWRNAFKILADKQTKEIGLILAAAFRDRDDMPDMLSDQQIVTRFSEDHYIHLGNFGSDETEVFLRGLLEEWIDDNKRNSLSFAHHSQCDGETMSPNNFPFTDAGLEKFVLFCCRRGGVTTPRDLQATLDTMLNQAIDDGRHVLSSTYITMLANKG